MLQHRDPWNPWPNWSAFALTAPTADPNAAEPMRHVAGPPLLVRCFVRGTNGVVESVAPRTAPATTG